MEADEIAMFNDLMRQSNHLGIINRFSRKLIRATTISEVAEELYLCISEFDLTCYITIQSDYVCEEVWCGNPERSLKYKLANADFKSTNVIAAGCFVIIQYSNISLIVLLESESQRPILQDTLATFCETANDGIVKVQHIADLELSYHNKSREVANDLQNLNGTLSRLSESLSEQQHILSQNLLLNFMTLFPSIALEQDQEDKILEIVEQVNGEIHQFVDTQSNITRDVKVSLDKVIDFLGYSEQKLEELHLWQAQTA